MHFHEKSYHHGRGGNRRGHRGYCVCVKCGYIEPHQAGVPCRIRTCPVCQIPLMRNDKVHDPKEHNESHHHKDFSLSLENHFQSYSDGSTLKSKEIPAFPYVNPNVCIGCWRCVEVCPTNAIIKKDNIAYILEDQCRRCFVCIKACPVKAIVKAKN